jgi:UDP-N-acetylmuramyl tripeptide synthase
MKLLEIVSTMGPSRRAEVTVVEMVLQAEPGEKDLLASVAHQLASKLPEMFNGLGLPPDPGKWAGIASRENPEARFAGYVCHTALLLQNAAGHRLEFEDFLADTEPASGETRYRLVFQHDDIPTGEQAGDLALLMVTRVCPEIRWKSVLHDNGQGLEDNIRRFVESSRPFVTAPETLALLKAARDRQVPALRLERQPYASIEANFRVSPNGMIMLGHSRHRVLMDGLYCVDKPGPGFSLMQDRRALWQLLAQLDTPLPADDISLMLAATLPKARRLATDLGYPLRLYPLQRDPAASHGWPIENESELEELLTRPEMKQHTFLLEPEIEGQTLDLLFAGGKPVSALLDGQPRAPEPEIVQCAIRIERAIQAGFLHIRCKVQAADEYGDMFFVVTHVDPAPPVCSLLEHFPNWQEQAFRQFLEWLYPPGAACRIPIAAITGTNGKTTTSTMLARMARAESLFVGMARTTGVYFDQELKEFGDSSGFLGHCMVFENPEVDLAILETARGDVLRSGFAYDCSDVAVCTNVTADHLGEHGVETVADMAVVKRSILERSRGAVVLNADDDLCLGMLPFLRGRKTYLSTFSPRPDELLAGLAIEIEPECNIIHVDSINNEDWIVLRADNAAIPIIAVNDIPATFNGAARHNTSNAMHAIAAAHALGFKLANIRQAMSRFEMGFDTLPGRLNVHDNGRFHIIMDYAHNADGLKQLIQFTRSFPCKGRKILRFGVSPNASEAACLRAAATAAGHYDHYICSARAGEIEPGKVDTAAVLQRGLLEAGVAPGKVEVFTDTDRAVEYPVSLCQPGDLLILVTSSAALESTWKKILQT